MSEAKARIEELDRELARARQKPKLMVPYFPEGGQTLTSHDVPNDTASHVDFYFYSGLFSQSLYAESEGTNGRKISLGSGSDAELWVLAVQDACGGDRSALDFPDEEMQGLLRQMQRDVIRALLAMRPMSLSTQALTQL